MNIFHKLIPRVQHANHAGLYQYYPMAVPDPGTQNYVFEPTFSLPPIDILGNASAVSKPGYFATSQPPQVLYQYAVPQAGIGGLQVGQLAFMPLTNPNDNTATI